MAAVIKGGVSIAIVFAIFALGHLIPLPGTFADAEWFGRVATPCLGFHCFGASPFVTHLDGIGTAHEPGLVLALAALAFVLIAVCGRRSRVPSDDNAN